MANPETAAPEQAAPAETETSLPRTKTASGIVSETWEPAAWEKSPAKAETPTAAGPQDETGRQAAEALAAQHRRTDETAAANAESELKAALQTADEAEQVKAHLERVEAETAPLKPEKPAPTERELYRHWLGEGVPAERSSGEIGESPEATLRDIQVPLETAPAAQKQNWRERAKARWEGTKNQPWGKRLKLAGGLLGFLMLALLYGATMIALKLGDWVAGLGLGRGGKLK